MRRERLLGISHFQTTDLLNMHKCNYLISSGGIYIGSDMGESQNWSYRELATTSPPIIAARTPSSGQIKRASRGFSSFSDGGTRNRSSL